MPHGWQNERRASHRYVMNMNYSFNDVEESFTESKRLRDSIQSPFNKLWKCELLWMDGSSFCLEGVSGRSVRKTKSNGGVISVWHTTNNPKVRWNRCLDQEWNVRECLWERSLRIVWLKKHRVKYNIICIQNYYYLSKYCRRMKFFLL